MESLAQTQPKLGRSQSNFFSRIFPKLIFRYKDHFFSEFQNYHFCWINKTAYNCLATYCDRMLTVKTPTKWIESVSFWMNWSIDCNSKLGIVDWTKRYLNERIKRYCPTERSKTSNKSLPAHIHRTTQPNRTKRNQTKAMNVFIFSEIVWIVKLFRKYFVQDAWPFSIYSITTTNAHEW